MKNSPKKKKEKKVLYLTSITLKLHPKNHYLQSTMKIPSSLFSRTVNTCTHTNTHKTFPFIFTWTTKFPHAFSCIFFSLDIFYIVNMQFSFESLCKKKKTIRLLYVDLYVYNEKSMYVSMYLCMHGYW